MSIPLSGQSDASKLSKSDKIAILDNLLKAKKDDSTFLSGYLKNMNKSLSEKEEKNDDNMIFQSQQLLKRFSSKK